MILAEPFRLEAQAYHRVWGGQRLRQDPARPIGELWVVHESNRLLDGPLAGHTLAEAVKVAGPALLGALGGAEPDRFPLLIKLLDTSDWLSVQVHPNDEQAAQLEGADQRGKTEAWHFIDVAPGGQVICGLRPGTTTSALRQAIADGTLLELVARQPVATGDTIFMPAGTIHALGPGLLLYEVQQSSDITYRVYDWGRQDPARPLHIAQSQLVARPESRGQLRPWPDRAEGERCRLTACPFFELELIRTGRQPVELDTTGGSCHALTVVSGLATIAGLGWRSSVAALETLIVPASVGPYRIEPAGELALLKASAGGGEPGCR